MADRFKSIKAQLDNKSALMDREDERIRKAVASLIMGYQRISEIPDDENGLRLAKKIAEAYAKFDIEDYYYDRPFPFTFL